MHTLRHLSRNMSTTLNKPTWTRLVRYIPQGGDVNGYRLGEPVSDTVDVGRSLYERPNEPILVHRFTGTSLLEPGERTGEQDTIGQVLSPVTPDQVGTIRCIGLNYQKHAVEANMPIPTEPVVFFKPASALTGSFPAPVIVPKFVVNDKDSADYESELAIVLSKEAKDVDEQDAMSYVLGYCAANDISSRQRQFATSQWCFSKSFDTACPLGPTVVAAHAIPDYTKLRMRGLKNGRVMQETGLDDLIFPIPKLIAHLSSGTTLPAGTVILTGTPHGIGLFYHPPETLKDGDVFTVEVTGGVGSLVNKIVFEQ